MSAGTTPHPLEDHVAQAARLAGLALDAERRAAVARQLAFLLQAAAQFADFPLGDDVTPAPVFDP